jgi:UPF0755 protein
MNRILVRLFLVLVVLAPAVAGGLAWIAHSPLESRQASVEFVVKPGSGLRAAGRAIEEAGVGLPAWRFELLARLRRQAGNIKAGTYEVKSGITPLQLLDMLVRGEVSQAQIAIIEGWTFGQLRAALDAHPALQHDSRDLTEAQILARLGAEQRAAEGLFFPDTYRFDRQSSDFAILSAAFQAMRRILEEEWTQRDRTVPYADWYQGLIAASLVEKETGRESDRAAVAAVFANRLRRGMPLQADPTVIYGLGESFDGNLRKPDLARDGAYNTYTRAGLPPTPIALPGRSSIRAAMQPAAHDYLYFVARGDGSSEFSTTLEAHNRAVMRYQKPLRREDAR